MTYQKIADELARVLRHHKWYHRTTLAQERDGDRKWHTWLRVWGTGRAPAKLPHSYKGLMIEWCRISPQHPCPFGSVKESDDEV